MFRRRVSSFGDLSASSMPRRKSSVYHCSEYWYMSPMLAMSATQKNRMEECFATGLYPALAKSIFTSVSSAIFCFSEISSDSTLDALST